MRKRDGLGREMQPVGLINVLLFSPYEMTEVLLINMPYYRIYFLVAK
ncbi:hypothetical protein PPBDW_I20659 [Photobacterium kishitanii]|nr:hypothetical protein PPBDW_I20659 [Photobacterium kishitanii]